jgi:hypothetical protein
MHVAETTERSGKATCSANDVIVQHHSRDLTPRSAKVTHVESEAATPEQAR